MKARRKITARGIAVGCVTLTMFLIGLLIGDGELMTLGACGLIFVALCFALARRNLEGLKLTVKMPSRFFAKRSVHADLELHNPRRWLSARQVAIRIRMVHRLERHAHAAWTGARASSRLKERLSIAERAEFSQLDYELSSGFPLGLFEVRSSCSATCPAVVYPQPITPPELLWGGLQADHHPGAGSAMGDLFGEPWGIRRYLPGDKAARIHQAASARSISRGQSLQVRAYDPPGFHPQRCRVVFHSHAKEGEIIRLDRFERALSMAAGTLTHLHNNHVKLVFQADFNHWECRPCEKRSEWIDCLVSLSRAQREAHTSAQALAEILQHAPRDEQLVIISDAPPDHWAQHVPKAHQDAMLIDIREVRFRKPGIQFQPAKIA